MLGGQLMCWKSKNCLRSHGHGTCPGPMAEFQEDLRDLGAQVTTYPRMGALRPGTDLDFCLGPGSPWQEQWHWLLEKEGTELVCSSVLFASIIWGHDLTLGHFLSLSFLIYSCSRICLRGKPNFSIGILVSFKCTGKKSVYFNYNKV